MWTSFGGALAGYVQFSFGRVNNESNGWRFYPLLILGHVITAAKLLVVGTLLTVCVETVITPNTLSFSNQGLRDNFELGCRVIATSLYGAMVGFDVFDALANPAPY